MNNYKLLTPGPLTTSQTVKKAMTKDRCTWDTEYKELTQGIRRQLLSIASAGPEEYTSVLMQGSGTFGVEAVLNSAIRPTDKCLFITNGAYGDRMVEIARRLGLTYSVLSTSPDCRPNLVEFKKILQKDTELTHVALVHCETTTGILNPLEEIAHLAKRYKKILIVDAMSSFGGIPIDVPALGIDFLISSANKCIQGVPGFSFVLAKKENLANCRGVSHSLSLDLYDQWQEMDKDGKWRFTSPTHTVAAFAEALAELEKEGGIAARHDRYRINNSLLRERLAKLNIRPYISQEVQSPVITTFLYPEKNFDFARFYAYVKQRGFVLYPGKLTDADTFRIGNIGEIYPADIEKLCRVIKKYITGGRHG